MSLKDTAVLTVFCLLWEICTDEAGAGRPHVDQPEAADLHHVAAATVDAEDIRCCRASSNEKKKITIKGCFMLCMFQRRLVLTAYSLFSRWKPHRFQKELMYWTLGLCPHG